MSPKFQILAQTLIIITTSTIEKSQKLNIYTTSDPTVVARKFVSSKSLQYISYMT